MSSAIFKHLEQSVFKVATASGSGTAFYLGKQNVFVTNHHVVSSYKKVSLQDVNGNCFLATVIVSNPYEDIALLVTDQSFDVPFLNLQVHTPEQGDKVFVAGYPFGMPFTITEGMVSASNQIINGRHFIQTDAAVNSGNSGGPMVNEVGDLVGITTCKINNADNMGFAVPTTKLLKQLESLSSLVPNSFNLVCSSCAGLIGERAEYCMNCGQSIEVSHFDEPTMSDISIFCEGAIEDLGIHPVLTRQSHECWQFYLGSSQIRMFIYNNSNLYVTSPINQLPSKNVDKLLEELLSVKIRPFQFGIYENEIYVSYRVAINDIFTSGHATIKTELVAFFNKANELDNYLASKFDCPYSIYTRPQHKIAL